MDVRAFLADHPPFDALTDEELDRVVASVQIEHFAPGTVILQQAGAPATHLFVVRRGAAEIVDDGRVIDEIGEGEVFGMWSLLGQVAPTATVRACEDTLCYLIDAEVANDGPAVGRRDRVRRGERPAPDRCRRRDAEGRGRPRPLPSRWARSSGGRRSPATRRRRSPTPPSSWRANASRAC